MLTSFQMAVPCRGVTATRNEKGAERVLHPLRLFVSFRVFRGQFLFIAFGGAALGMRLMSMAINV